MGAGFNLGGYGGQLTADELQRALAAVGGGRMDPAMEAPPQLQPPPVMPQEPPPPVQEAPPPPVDEPPEPPPDMSVQRARGGPAKAIDTYQGENLEDANKRIESAGRAGDEKTGQDAKSYDAQAEIRGRQASQTKSNIDTARSQVEERRAHEQRYQQEADRLYEEMRAHTQPPPQSTVSKVLGIVGAVAAMGGGNKGAAQGLGMLSSMLGSDTERWAAEQQANSGLYQAALASVGSDRQGMQSDLDVAQRMTALEAHEIDASLEQVKAMGLSRNATRTAEDLQLQMRQKVRDGLIGMEAAKAKAAAARGSSAQRDAAWRMDLEDLRKLASGVDVVVNGQTIRAGIGEDWQKILAERTKADQAYRGGEADIRKKQGEAGTGEGQEVLPGMVATVPLERKDVSDIRANAQVLSKIKGNYAKLTEIRERNKGNPLSQWTNKADAVKAQNIISEMTGVMNQFAGRGAPSNLELDDMKKQLLDPTENYVLTDPTEVYNAQVERLEQNFQAGLEAVGVRPVGQAGGGERPGSGPQASSGDPRVRRGFSAPSAGSVGIQRDSRGGIALPRTTDPTPQELASAYLSEEGVPKEWLK